MIGIQNYSSFIVAIFVFQIIPGAGTVAILNATARNGIGSGMKAVFGTLSGDFIYMLTAVLGLAAILSAYPRLLDIAQWFGITYLFFVGWKLLKTSSANQASDLLLKKGGWTYFWQALAVSLTNPKVIMFFMAFFPLFLGDESRPVTLFILMVHVTVISFVYQTCLVLVCNVIMQRLLNWKYARVAANRLAGITLIALGAKLAFNKR
jgi:leucine efflux protein